MFRVFEICEVRIYVASRLKVQIRVCVEVVSGVEIRGIFFGVLVLEKVVLVCEEIAYFVFFGKLLRISLVKRLNRLDGVF